MPMLPLEWYIVNSKFSSAFPCMKRVRQGCNLTPLLFSLFISDLESYRLTNMAGNITLASRKVQLLLFADDLILLADSSKGLQDSLYWLTEFCKTRKLNINTTKAKVVIFNRRRNIHQILLILDNMELEYVSSYKYLGIINRRRACAERVTVVVLCVCMSVTHTLFWQYGRLKV